MSRVPGALWPALLVAVCAISCAAIFFRLAGDVDPMFASAVRLGCSALCFVPWALWDVRRAKIPEGFWKVCVVAGGLYALHFGAWVWSLQLTSVASSVTLVTITPVMLAIWGWWTGRDAPSRRLVYALGCACVGVVILGISDLQGGAANWRGDLLAVLGAAAMGGYFVWVRPLAGRLPLGLFSCVTCTVGASVLACVCTLTLDAWPSYSRDVWGWMLMASLIPQVVGHTLLTWSLRHVTPTMAGVVTLGEPVGATLLGVWWLGEMPGVVDWLACGVILSGVLWSTCVMRQSSRSRLAPQGRNERE